MIIKLTPIRNKLEQMYRLSAALLERHWLKLIVSIFVCFLMLERNLTLEVRLSTTKPAVNLSSEAPPATGERVLPTSQNDGARAVFASENSEKRQRQLAYIRRFAKVAQAEMEKFGIPASITLAQGLLESNVGESKLATHNKNHFGIKCFSRSCKKGHCSNFTDDSHKDFFRIYKSSWDSYRAHSLLLKGSSRYQPLFQLNRKDYRGWAHGLKKAGYATDKRYGEKLINLIDDLDLHQYDQ